MTGDEAIHKCGVAAVSIKGSIEKHPTGGSSYYLYKMLLQQQNRGQLSAGITTYYKKRKKSLKTYKKLGGVAKVFRAHHKFKNQVILNNNKGTKGIGHTRYATCGTETDELAQPFERIHGRKWKWFSMAFNGNIANFSELKKKLKKKQYQMIHDTDTEVIMHYISRGLIGDAKASLTKVFNNLSKKLDGAYCIVFMNADGQLVAARDPYGFRPLVYGSNNEICAAASESTALINLGITKFKSVKPGHMVFFNGTKMTEKKFATCPRTAHCMFEWVYFANVGSTIDNKSVYRTRWALGKHLADREFLKVNPKEYVVVPVPDTAKPIGDSYALALGLPSMEGLLRNRYVGRTFIESRDRMEKIRDKFTINLDVTKGKKVILVEDSVVRGNTSKTLVDYVRKEGQAKEVHVRVASPPIFFPCFYGIDMSTMDELIASRLSTKKYLEKNISIEYPKKLVDKIKRNINADSLVYQTIPDLIESIGMPAKKLCTACLDGKYPTPYGKKLFKKSLAGFKKGKNLKNSNNVCKRAYE